MVKDWISVNPSSGETMTPVTGTPIVISACTSNTSSKSRKATLIFKSGSATHKIEVTQKATQEPVINDLLVQSQSLNLLYGNSVVLNATSNNNVKWEVATKDETLNAYDYVSTAQTTDTKDFTLKYDKKKITVDKQTEVKLCVSAISENANSIDFHDYKVIYPRLLEETPLNQFEIPVVELNDCGPTYATYVIYPSKITVSYEGGTENIYADTYVIRWGFSPNKMDEIETYTSQEYTDPSKFTGITYTCLFEMGNKEVFLKAQASDTKKVYDTSDFSVACRAVIKGSAGDLTTPTVVTDNVTPIGFNAKWDDIKNAAYYKVYVSPDTDGQIVNNFDTLDELMYAAYNSEPNLVSYKTNVNGALIYPHTIQSTEPPTAKTDYFVCVIAYPSEDSDNTKSHPGGTTQTWEPSEGNYFIVDYSESLPKIFNNQSHPNCWTANIITNTAWTSVVSGATLSPSEGNGNTTIALSILENEKTDNVEGLLIVTSETVGRQERWTWNQLSTTYHLGFNTICINVSQGVKKCEFYVTYAKNGVKNNEMIDRVEIDDETLLDGDITVTELEFEEGTPTNKVEIPLKTFEGDEYRLVNVTCYAKDAIKKSRFLTLVFAPKLTPAVDGVEIFATQGNWALGRIKLSEMTVEGVGVVGLYVMVLVWTTSVMALKSDYEIDMQFATEYGYGNEVITNNVKVQETYKKGSQITYNGIVYYGFNIQSREYDLHPYEIAKFTVKEV